VPTGRLPPHRKEDREMLSTPSPFHNLERNQASRP
jgi:hypothetical protein